MFLFDDTEGDEAPEAPEDNWSAAEIALLRKHCRSCGECLRDAFCSEYEGVKAKLRRQRMRLTERSAERKPYGSFCRVNPYRLEAGYAPLPETGHFLRTTAGSCYLILDIRLVGGDPYRLNLSCQRIDPATLPQGAVVHALFWDRRNGKNGKKRVNADA